MNIETSSVNNVNKNQNQQKTNSANNTDKSVKFSDELNDLKKVEETNDSKKPEETEDTKNSEKSKEKSDIKNEQQDEQINDNANLDGAIDGLNSVVQQFNKKDAINQSDENENNFFKNYKKTDDNKEKGEELMSNEMNIRENKDILPQIAANMNFSSDKQPFSSFMNDEQTKKTDKITASAKDLAEEAAILSTMAENIAIAKNVQQAQEKSDVPEQKTVNKNEGIKTIDIQSGITIETVVKYDNVVMNKADVEVFTNLVQNGEVNLNNLAPESAKESVAVSKTLADLLAKAKETNQPLRIDFDNDISVIIRISRDGKLSADFLPSSQVAEAYLKENLPLLKQRFDENNVQYDELNQKEQRNRERENDRRKGKNNE